MIKPLETVFVSKMWWAKGATIVKWVISTSMPTMNSDAPNVSALVTLLIVSSVVDMSKVGSFPKAIRRGF